MGRRWDVLKLMSRTQTGPQGPAPPSARRGAETVLVEATRKPLKKVLASGGGRCNVIHDPTMAVTDIVERYLRGRREIRGPFTSLFGPDDMRRWFEAEGVELKTEADGRVFPVTDDSQTVADALRNAAHKAGVLFKGGAAATTIDVAGDGFAVKTGDDAYDAAAVVLATGSAAPVGMYGRPVVCRA